MIRITCNMGSRDLLDMYALSPQVLGIHIRQIPPAHVTTYTSIPNRRKFLKFFRDSPITDVLDKIFQNKPEYRKNNTFSNIVSFFLN